MVLCSNLFVKPTNVVSCNDDLYQSNLLTIKFLQFFSDDDKIVLASFSKNFLPILFNLYTTPPTEEECKERADKQSLLLDCIKAYIFITGKKYCHSYHKTSDLGNL